MTKATTRREFEREKGRRILEFLKPDYPSLGYYEDTGFMALQKQRSMDKNVIKPTKPQAYIYTQGQ